MYTIKIFKRVYKVLNDRGQFVIWSCSEEHALMTRLEKVFDICHKETVIEKHQGRNVEY